MGVSLFDRKTREIVFDVNFWHYRAVVEVVRSLGVLPDEKVGQLHESWVGHGLTEDECRLVAEALRARVLPTLHEGERLLLDGTCTTESDDGTFYREPDEQHLNYSTNRAVLLEFTRCCETCGGFDVC